MTRNNLTEERINGLLSQYDEQEFNDVSDTELMAALRELQQRRAADKNYFLYGIADPGGRAHVDEFCVSIDLGEMQAAADELNQNEGTGGYRAVALYTALPLTGDERQELLQYREAAAAPVSLRWRWYDGGEHWTYAPASRMPEFVNAGFTKKNGVEIEYLYTAPQPLAEAVGEPYAYLRENDGQIQISIGHERPHDRSGGYATPWSAVYAAPQPLADEERIELQQYRKAESADREMLKRLAVILSGSDAPGEIRALTVTAQSFVDRCKLLAQERDKHGQ